MQYRQAIPWAIFTKFSVVDGFVMSVLRAKCQYLYNYRYRNVGLSKSKSRKFRIFGKNLPLRDKFHWAIFTKLGAGEGVPGPYPHAKISSRLWLLKCGLTGAKIGMDVIGEECECECADVKMLARERQSLVLFVNKGARLSARALEVWYIPLGEKDKP